MGVVEWVQDPDNGRRCMRLTPDATVLPSLPNGELETRSNVDLEVVEA